MWWLRRTWNAKVVEAICLGDVERLCALHRQGIRMDARSHTGETYLHRVAALSARRAGEVAETLIKLGADVNATMTVQSRPLHTAAIAGNLEVVEVLLNHGADIDAQNEYGFTALHYAVGHDEIEIVKLLMDRGANALLATGVGDSPLAIAQRNEAWEIADMLWDTQFNALAFRGGHTPFRIAMDAQTVH
jgi:ankyrin repeat protein